MFGEQFPYTNFHDLNLDWILKTVKEIANRTSQEITIQDPIDWDIRKSYPQYTIVMDNDIAYLSTKPVPSGTLISNTDYWQPIFDFTTFFDELDALDDKITAERTARIGADEDLATAISNEAQARETAISNEAQARTEAINNLKQNTLRNNKAKHLLVLGDSYVVWFNNQMYNEIVNGIGIPSAQCHNVAVSGASFQDATNSFLMQAQGYTGDKTQITDILVIGGINDALLAYNNYTNVYPDVTALTGAISAFKTYCNANYPNAIIHTAYVGGCLATSLYYNTLHPAKSQEWAMWAYTVYAQSIGIDVLETYNAIHQSPNNYYEDGLHPNSAYGVTAIAQTIIACFNEQVPVTNRPTMLVSITASGISASGTLAGFLRVVNNEASLSVPDQYVLITIGEVIGNVEKEIATLADSGFIVRNPYYIHTIVTLNGFGLAEAKQVPAMIILRDGKVYIKVYIPGTTDWETLTAIGDSSISFSGIGEIQLPVWSIN